MLLKKLTLGGNHEEMKPGFSSFIFRLKINKE